MNNEDGYNLWLRYPIVSDSIRLHEYRNHLTHLYLPRRSQTLEIAHKEITMGLEGLLGKKIPTVPRYREGGILLGTGRDLQSILSPADRDRCKACGPEGFYILRTDYGDSSLTIITANTEIGVLYGSFHFLKSLCTHTPMEHLCVSICPRIKLRLLNHWDNPDRTVERGYAGFSLWDWHRLPDLISPRYHDYARANASIGINATVLNNVNANALSLTTPYLEKAQALADLFRPYGIKVFLSVRFSSPMEIGGLTTSDPDDPEVNTWWREKVSEIYNYIPDFGGFLVKANSEGQPGPHDYKKDHAHGANLLARALHLHGGVVIWRAFVYDFNLQEDRAKQAYTQFVPLDSKFMDNVVIQVKNGPIDFQPREPFHPLFGAMKKTSLFPEFQITQEYLGLATHLVYLGTLFKECLDSDTYACGENSTVATVIDGSLFHTTITGIAGVSNIGTDRNWCGHHFAQANWYAYGSLAWDHTRKAEEIALEWLRLTFTNDPDFTTPVLAMMMTSRETAVNYMTPLGLHHIMAWNHHYGPGPWVDQGRKDWRSTYYHQAETGGIGFDRSKKGSDGVSQYKEPLAGRYDNPRTCPENLLLWFHHLPWDFRVASHRTLWEELCYLYDKGVSSVRDMAETWDTLESYVDKERFSHIRGCLFIQEKEARWWRDACLLYFQQFSRMDFPPDFEPPAHTLTHYMNRKDFFVPGIHNPF